MLDYQKAVIMFLVCFVLAVLVIGFVESRAKKHKAKKEAYAKLEKENKQLKDTIYRLRFCEELRGVKLDV